MKLFKILLLICFLTSIHFLNAQKISSFEGKSKEELYNWSIETNVTEEKQKLRSYLAEKFPNTMEGETAKAWITTKEGYDEKGTQMYLEVIKKYPKPWLAIINSLDAATKDNIDEIVANYEKMLTVEPSYSNYLGARNLYFTLKTIDKKAAEDKLLFWEAKLGSNIYVFDFIRGINAENDKDYKLAETYYATAITKKGGSIELNLWTRLINLRKDKLFDNQNKTVNDQVDLYMPLLEEAKLHLGKKNIIDKTFASGAFEFLGDFLIDKDNRLAIQMFDSAFTIYPSFSLIDKKMNPMLHMGKTGKDLLDVLINAETYLPDNASLQSKIAEKYIDLNNVESSEKYYKLAIENSVLITSVH